MHPFASLIALAALAAPALAQATLGITDNTNAMLSSRGSTAVANFNPVTVFNRIDREKYAGWGYSDANPGFREIHGVHYILQDQDASTAESFSVVIYTEDPARPDYPLVAAPIATIGPLSWGGIGSGIAAYQITTTFGTPILVPAGADVFLGITLHTPFNATLTDGPSIQLTIGVPNSSTGQADLPGGSAPAGLTFGGYYEATSQTLAYSSPLLRQYYIDPILQTGGVALVQHYGDALHPAANTHPGTGCMFSSQYPDSSSPSRNAGRADDIAMSWAANVPDGTLVFFLADVSLGFGPEVPLSAYAPGSTGALCLNAGSMTVLGFATTQTGLAYYQIVWGPAVRPYLPGLPLAQQGIALDAANGSFRAGPAQISIL
jgi:hypothetical protein